MREAGVIETGGDGVAKRLCEGDEAFRREFLGADFDQEIVVSHVLPEGTVLLTLRAKMTVPVPVSPRSIGKPCASRLA